jgi:hypothetical protein
LLLPHRENYVLLVIKSWNSPYNGPWRPRGGVEVQLYSFFNLGARWGGWSTPRLDRFTIRKETRYQLYRSLGGSQGRSGRMRKISPPLGFDPRTVQPVASRYTDYATASIRKTNKSTICTPKHMENIVCGKMLNVLMLQQAVLGLKPIRVIPYLKQSFLYNWRGKIQGTMVRDSPSKPTRFLSI